MTSKYPQNKRIMGQIVRQLMIDKTTQHSFTETSPSVMMFYISHSINCKIDHPVCKTQTGTSTEQGENFKECSRPVA